MAVGAKMPLRGYDDTRKLFYSIDGKEWEEVSSNLGGFDYNNVDYLGGRYVAHSNYDSDIAYSYDGKVWEHIKCEKDLGTNEMIYSDGKYISVGSGFDDEMNSIPAVATSTDLIEWTLVDNDLDDYFVGGILEFDNEYYLTAYDGDFIIIYKSTNLSDWNRVYRSEHNGFCELFVVDDTLVLTNVANGLYAINGGRFQTDIMVDDPNFYDVVYNGERLVLASGKQQIGYSMDGRVWEMMDSPYDGSAYGTTCDGEYFYNLVPELNSQGNLEIRGIYRSVDGLEWERIGEIIDDKLYTFEYVNDMFFAYGSEGNIWYSQDGSEFIKAVSGESNYINDVEYFKGSYYAGSYYGKVLVSVDGISWSSLELEDGADVNCFSTNGRNLMAVTSYGQVYCSTDGVEFINCPIDTTNSLEKVIWDGQQYVIFGMYGEYYKTVNGSEIVEYFAVGYGDVREAIWDGEQYIIVGLDASIATCVPTDFVKVEVNGHPVVFDVAPKIINDRTMIPARAVFEQVGATVEWEGATSSVVVKKSDTEIVIKIGSETATVNGVSKVLDSPAVIIDNRTLVPVRFIAEELGMAVEWDGVYKVVGLRE